MANYIRNTTSEGIAIGVGPVTPSSVKYQWTAKNFADPWPADVGGVDMTINGGLSTSSMNNGETGVLGDGSDDSALAPIADIGKDLNSCAWEFDCQYSSGGGWEVIGHQRPWFEWRFDNDHNFNSDNGNIVVNIASTSQNRLTFAPTNNPGLDDGNVHKISILLNDLPNNDAEMIIDGSNLSLSYRDKQNPSISSNIANTPAFWGRNASGSIGFNFGGYHSIFRIHDEPISSQTI
jgi:hypothetical protein